MAKKRKSRFSSLSTPGLKQDCSNYLVELVFLRSNKGTKLPSKFWQQQRYKWRYRREIQACRKFIKNFGEPAVLSIAIAHPEITTWTDFAKVEFLLQQIEESRVRRALPKDTSEVVQDSVKVNKDFRDFSPQKPKQGLLERLKELNNG